MFPRTGHALPNPIHRYDSGHRVTLDLQLVTHPAATWQFLNHYYDAQSIRHRLDKAEPADSTAG
jgi:hypothetical protein